MVKDTIQILNPTGLHTRPAKKVVAEAKKFSSRITIKFKDKEADAKSLLKIMKLGISQHHSIELECEGQDEAEALEFMKEFINGLEG